MALLLRFPIQGYETRFIECDSAQLVLSDRTPNLGANSVVGGDRVRTVISHQADKKELIRYFVTSLLSKPDDQLTKYRMSF